MANHSLRDGEAMALRKPLVLVGGNLGELPASDTLDATVSVPKIIKIINQPGHGFSRGNPVRRDSGGYAKAQADTFDHCKSTVGIVEDTYSNSPILPCVQLLLHMNGTDQATVFTDSSTYGRTVTAEGDARIITAQSKFGGACGQFRQQNSDIKVTPSGGLILGTVDFVLDAWLRFNGDYEQANNFIYYHDPTHHGMTINVTYGSNGELDVGFDGTTLAFLGMAEWDLATWFHLALIRSGNNLRAFRNGVQFGNTKDITGANLSATADILIGMDPGGSYGWYGQLDEFQISGPTDARIASWWNGFTPPMAEYGASDSFLLNMGGEISMPDAIMVDGSLYYVDATTPGGRTASPPSTSGQVQFPILVATGITTGIVRIGQGIVVP